MRKVTRRSVKTIATILEAAGRVIRRLGSTGLTIDAVAAEAEVSKGGVLHHFASKDALIAAMVAHQLASMQEALHRIEAELPAGAAAPLRAVIEHARVTYAEEGFPPALLAASVESPGALDGYRSVLSGTLRRLERVADQPDAAVVLFFAMLGLFLTKSLGFHVFDEAQVQRFLDTAARMAAGLEEG